VIPLKLLFSQPGFDLILFSFLVLLRIVLLIDVLNDTKVVQTSPLRAIESQLGVFTPVCEPHARDGVVSFEHTDNVLKIGLEAVVEL